MEHELIIIESDTGEVKGRLSQDISDNVKMELALDGYELYPENEYKKFGLDECRRRYDLDVSN